MAMNFQKIPFIRLTKTQKAKALEVLGRGTVLLKKWAVYSPPKKHRQFRNAIMDGSLNPPSEDNPCGVIPADKLCEFHKDLPFIKAIRYEIHDELEGRTCEQAILEGFAALAERFVIQWRQPGDPTGITYHDLLQEAYMQIIEAIYCWLPECKVELSTYIWVALENRMSNVVNQQGNLLCRLTNDDLVLFTKYEKARKKSEMDGSSSFDEIISQLGFSSEEGIRLDFILKKVYTETRLNELDVCRKNEVRGDYTGRGERLKEASKNSHTDDVVEQSYVNDMLDKSGLNELEREVIEAAMNPFNGWQTAFAENHINPQTNKPYSRMRITQVLTSAREKVALVLKRQEKKDRKREVA